jgi:hypothetical protein
MVDTESRTHRLINTIVPPPEIHSGFGIRMLGWSIDGSKCYAEVLGHSGLTSATPVIRWSYEIDAMGQMEAREISSVPDNIVLPRNGEFDATRRPHIWPTDVSVQTWTSDGAPTSLLFTLDPVSGQLKEP